MTIITILRLLVAALVLAIAPAGIVTVVAGMFGIHISDDVPVIVYAIGVPVILLCLLLEYAV